MTQSRGTQLMAAPSDERPAPESAAIRVLLVEDDEDYADLIRDFLARSTIPEGLLPPVSLSRATSVREATDALLRGGLDLVLLDLHLPDSSGLDTIERIQQAASGVAIVVLTASGDPDLAVLALQRGAQDYLVKGTVREEVLARSLRYALERSRLAGNLRAAESERARAEDRVGRIRHLESVGVLAGGVGHDFNNLLMAILGNVHKARKSIRDPATLLAAIDRIEESARHGAQLTARILAYAGRGVFDLVPLDLSNFLRETLPFLDALVPRSISIVIDAAAGLPEIEADPAQVRQLLVHLVANSGEAIGNAPGTIRIATRLEALPRARIEEEYLIDDVAEDAFVLLEMKDTGPGIDEATRRRLFEPFFSTRSPGRGLGLAASLGIVRGHRGGIRVESAPGEGATIRVLFPVPTRPGGIPAEAPSPPGSVPPTRPTVLVVDDEVEVLEVLSFVLEDAGFQVETAPGGSSAIERASALGDAISLVLLDLTMPGLDGVETFRELRNVIHAPVLLMSGYDARQIAGRCREEGFVGFLQKPTLPSVLVDRVRAVLASVRA